MTKQKSEAMDEEFVERSVTVKQLYEINLLPVLKNHCLLLRIMSRIY